ncbi:PKD domain-containing protein [Nocardioides pyridinolyticus]
MTMLRHDLSRVRHPMVSLLLTFAVGVLTALAAVVTSTTPAQAADAITFRASAQAAWNQTTARVTIPASVRETDGMLLFVTANTNATVTTPPAGWTLVGSRLASTDTETFLYSRVATANDAGRNAAVTFSATTKSTMNLLAYDGTALDDPIDTFASAAEVSPAKAAHTTPGATVATAGSYVVSYWVDKFAQETNGWTLPAGQTQRSIMSGVGAGRISAVASDTNAPVAAGASPGRTATSAVSTVKATMWTVVLEADQTANPNVAPVASFTVSCPTATCTVDASGSSDTAPGTITSYAWDFGDGTTGTGVSTTHTYETGGAKTITLRVTDNQGLESAPATRTANPVVSTPGAGVPGHTRLVPDRPRANTPRISNGEIWDIEVVPQLNRVFIAGSFTSLANTVAPTTTINQAGLASYNLTTGLIDTNFRPSFNGGVAAVEASPDGTKLFVGGSFNTVNGVTKQKVASLNPTTGAPLSTFGFTNNTNNQVQSLAATNDTLYVGGRYTRVNGVLRTGLAAVNAASGVVDQSFDNSLSGGIGVNGQLGVPQLKLTHDLSKLLVIHTGRQIDGQDRLGMGIIDTATEQLLPWRSTLWDENLARVGGVTRICCGDIAPDDSYFVVSSGSGGDAPPISDTVIAYPLDAASLEDPDVQPLWIARHFDSIYSVAITEVAVYVGGHFQFIESPSSDEPYPGLDNVGYGTGQGLAGYGLGDQVVRRDHIAALNPVDGRSLEWNPTGGSNSFEGDKAMEATPRGLFVGGDGMWKGGVNTGRVAFFDFNTVTFPPALPDTTITTPIEGRVVANNVPFDITGTARVATGTVGRVQVQVQDRESGQYLQDNGTAFTTFGATANTLNATLGGSGTTRTWSIPATITTNRNLIVSAQAFTAATGGTGDSTRATKKFESFSTDDQTPATSITGPSGVQTSTTFTMTGTANDDRGVNRLTYWFRDEQQRYLQDDGTVDDIFNTFGGEPDVIGATNATWSYEVTLPHEGVWRGSATAVDTAGQADLRSATRDWTVDSNAVAPTVAIAQPVEMTPPFTVPPVTVQPGSPMTFSGTATDDEGLKNVEVTLRNTSTGQNLSNDCSWGTNVSAGTCRISPVDISGFSYNWSWTTPFNLSPGTYTFTVRATDDDNLTTATANRGSLTINAQIAGDLPPDATFPFTAPTDESLVVNLAGTATDDIGVDKVQVLLQERDTGRYLQPNGTMSATATWRDATLGTPGGTSTTWSLGTLTLPTGGSWRFTMIVFDTSGQQDASPAAAVNYAAYPNDDPPALSDTLGQPQTGASFTDGKIVVTGRAEDAPNGDVGIAQVQVGVVNAAGQWMSSTGTFTSTTPSYRTAFLNSPGSAGSNYSYTTPAIASGTYTVRVRPVDIHNQIGVERVSTGVTVSQPSNNPPTASFTYSCNQNVCSFDGRGSTDENTSSLVYTWTFAGSGTTTNGTGALPTRTWTAPGTFAVTLTVRDEWNVTSAPVTQNVTITEPSGNGAPVPTFTRSCTGLTCSVTSSGTTDPNNDPITYTWAWGDGTPNTVTTSTNVQAHTYAAAGTYTITLTAADGWGKSASTTQNVTLSEPATNTAPTATFTASCASFTVCQMNSTGTSDPQGDAIRYTWNWGDGTADTTGTNAASANPSHTYNTPGTYTITLTASDVWGKAGTATREVTITEPAGNNAPTAVIASGTCTSFTTCSMSATGSSDPDTAAGDGIRDYVWSWGDGTPDTTGTSVNQSHVFPVAGTYTVTLRVVDKWGRASAPVTTSVTTQVEPAGNNPPTATFAPSCSGRVCLMNATSSDSDGGIRGSSWTFGDGTTSTSTNPSKTYAAAGTYTITLVVTDNWGRSTTVTREVTVT